VGGYDIPAKDRFFDLGKEPLQGLSSGQASDMRNLKKKEGIINEESATK